MPITFVTFVCVLPGDHRQSRRSPAFFTKDPIIDAGLRQGRHLGRASLGTAALIGAGITAFYMTRVMLMTFFGERRWDEDAHPHEAPPVMTWPMILLAIGALGAGAFLMLGDRLIDFLGPVTGYAAVVARAVVTPAGDRRAGAAGRRGDPGLGHVRAARGAGRPRPPAAR